MINRIRIFAKLIIMLCMYTYIQAALNFVDHSATAKKELASFTPDATALKKALETHVEAESIEVAESPEKTIDKKESSASDQDEIEDEEEETVEFHFEDADLQNLLNQIALLYDVTFITDDIVTPLADGKKAIKGNKLSFKTHKPLTRKAAWNLFLTFLEIAGFSLTKETKPNFYRVVSLDAVKKSPIPAFIGTNPRELPQNDQIIRYVYFAQNTNIETIFPIVDALRSNVSSLKELKDLQAIILTDKAFNIVSLMEIVSELDKVTMPQAMSVLKLRRADAQEVKKLYDSITQTEEKGVSARLFPTRKPSTAVYFPENTRIIAYPRTNALILLGSEDAIKKIEDFITQHVDVELSAPYTPIRMYKLKHADAERVAELMNEMAQFGKETEAGKSGGVRGGDKYLKRMQFTADKESNKLIIQGDEEDYLYAKEIIEKLDEPQPQVAIEILILNLTLNNMKQLGAQIRSKVPGPDGLLGSNVEFQTSGLYGGQTRVQTRASDSSPESGTMGANRLLADLISLAVGAPAGNTLVSLGSDIYGVWGMFQALNTISNTQVIANPFLVATNKTPAKVSIGETRRVVVSTVVGTATEQSRDDLEANLDVSITPQINSDGMIIMKLQIKINQFTDPNDFESATRNTKELNTSTIVANGEVLALGGLIQNRSNSFQSGTPWLEKIPLFGWFFKNRSRDETKDNLLIMIMPRILPPDSDTQANEFTNEQILGYHTTLGQMLDAANSKDPVSLAFFEPKEDSSTKVMEDYLFDRKNAKSRKRRHKSELKHNQKARKRADRSAFAPRKEVDHDIHTSKTDVAEEEAPHDVTPIQNNGAVSRSPHRKKRSISTMLENNHVAGEELS